MPHVGERGRSRAQPTTISVRSLPILTYATRCYSLLGAYVCLRFAGTGPFFMPSLVAAWVKPPAWTVAEVQLVLRSGAPFVTISGICERSPNTGVNTDCSTGRLSVIDPEFRGDVATKFWRN